MKTKLTGQWLYEAHFRARGALAIAVEHRIPWRDLPPRARTYWNALAAAARRRLTRKPKRAILLDGRFR